MTLAGPRRTIQMLNQKLCHIGNRGMGGWNGIGHGYKVVDLARIVAPNHCHPRLPQPRDIIQPLIAQHVMPRRQHITCRQPAGIAHHGRGAPIPCVALWSQIVAAEPLHRLRPHEHRCCGRPADRQVQRRVNQTLRTQFWHRAVPRHQGHDGGQIAPRTVAPHADSVVVQSQISREHCPHRSGTGCNRLRIAAFGRQRVIHRNDIYPRLPHQRSTQMVHRVQIAQRPATAVEIDQRRRFLPRLERAVMPRPQAAQVKIPHRPHPDLGIGRIPPQMRRDGTGRPGRHGLVSGRVQCIQPVDHDAGIRVQRSGGRMGHGVILVQHGKPLILRESAPAKRPLPRWKQSPANPGFVSAPAPTGLAETKRFLFGNELQFQHVAKGFRAPPDTVANRCPPPHRQPATPTDTVTPLFCLARPAPRPSHLTPVSRIEGG